MLRSGFVFLLVTGTVLATTTSTTLLAEEPITLIGTIVKWRYPGAEIGQSEMTDAATIDAGTRTVPSSMLKTTIATPDSVEKVLAFYHDLPEQPDQRTGIGPEVGRSVIFSDESEGRQFAFHTILINSAETSTTLIITRADGEDRTHITWKQYLRHKVGGQ